MIEKLRDDINTLVWTGYTGAAVLGFSRAGKTSALQVLYDDIHGRDGRKVPVLMYSAHRRDKTTIRSLYENILNRLNVHYVSTNRTELLVRQLVEFLSNTAADSNAKQIILAVDETQRLSIAQIDVFAELDDILRSEFGISMMCLFIGNKEQMGTLLERIYSGENQHICGRFFRRQYKFHGLRSIEDVEACLRQYDTKRFPAEGPTYTEFFLPEDYKKGFRLASVTNTIWRVYRAHKQHAGVSEWAMDYFIRATNILLVDYLTRYGVDRLSDEMFDNCIRLSGLYPEMLSYNDNP